MVLMAALVAVFGIELATGTMGSETALLRLGALPTSGGLGGGYWRLFAYSFLHLNWTHLILNLALLWWTGRIVERRVGTARASLIYTVSVLSSAATILLVMSYAPKPGSAVGASGGIWGLLGAAMVLVYRRDAAHLGQDTALRTGLWLCLLAGLGLSLLPNVSLAGHAGGLVPGVVLATTVTIEHRR
jgi:rhomboid protease GluP